ncbi:hypothetical protein PLESTB_001564200 [Pleodorina starrii]|uniref:Uncharacterized protein n=1 Tax=Pleodorina starrii TaxID=330485 RepID=A0A9W6BXQ3_9CHLO|nr:hypothetical protein PLESTB_001564200 [Pleodorina starrii]GLC72755.1 hypothetical protein PLESTF_001289900 [Pleodorina starrii]
MPRPQPLKQRVVFEPTTTMAVLAGSELVFALDSQSFSSESICGILEHGVKVQPSKELQLCAQLSRGGLCEAAWQGVEETRFQRTVRQQLLKSQQAQHLMMLLPYEHVPASVSGQSWSSHSSSPLPLKELCLALRLQDLDARLLLPVPLPGFGCGRQSTGGGGQCATGGGKRCFFCSRQPYAVVRCPPTWGAEDEDGGGGGLRQQPREQQQQQQHKQKTAMGVVSEPPADSGAAPPPPSPSSPPPPPPLVLVVEPCLRELFRVAPSTPEYADIVEGLPQVWVGPRAALLDLAERMCDAMAINFRSQGLDVPPWRRRTAVLSRWDERNHHELPLEPEPQPRPGTEMTLSGTDNGPGQAAGRDVGGVSFSAIRSASASADAAEAPACPQKAAAEATTGATSPPPGLAPASGSACGPCAPACAPVVPEAAAAAAAAQSGGLQSRRLGDGQRVFGCCGYVHERPAAPAPSGKAQVPAVVVYGFDLPGPARAV